MIRWILAAFAVVFAVTAAADGERPGRHDYYVLALSWQPTWCALEGDARGAPVCATDAGWTLHGLWPQYETGWPAWCPSATREATRAETAAMGDIMGSDGLAWYQWRKHGRCSGLAPDAYFDASREAFEAVTRPSDLRAPDPTRLAPAAVEAAFLDANPALAADGITITCRSGRIAEARVCLTRDLTPRRCGRDVIRDCDATSALLAPVR